MFLYSDKLKFTDFDSLVDIVDNILGTVFPNIHDKKQYVKKIINEEFERVLYGGEKCTELIEIKGATHKKVVLSKEFKILIKDDENNHG